MNVSQRHRISQMAASFWHAAGITPIYPLTFTELEQAAFLLYPINIVKLNNLSISRIGQWLTANAFCHFDGGEEKRLFGLLFVRNGHAFIFLDGTDIHPDQMLTFAHELAHYLLEIDYPRKRAVQKFGPSILEVFDGIRQPSVTEKLAGMISKIEIGPHLHLLEKESMNYEARWRIWEAENEADALALELLAPERMVKTMLLRKGLLRQLNKLNNVLPSLLEEWFEIPDTVAKAYAKSLVFRWNHGGTSVANWLGRK